MSMLGAILDRCTDISELLEVFRMIFDTNLIGITIVRPDGEIIYYNEAQAHMDGLSPAEVLGKKICDVYHFTPEDSPTMRSLETRKPIFDRVHLYRTRNGKLVNSSNSIYPLWGNGVFLGGICFLQSYTVIGRQIGFLDTQKTEGEKRGGLPSVRKREDSPYTFQSLVGESSILCDAVNLAKKASQSASSIMLVGETGVGKEIFAQAIHHESPRRAHPYTAINCSAVPETLLEGILFGTVKGAFTGAVNRPGLFEVTDGGTLYLDEIDSMPVSLQNKLLRVLQERKVRRVGEERERPIDVRIVSSVGKSPVSLVEAGQLRQDFYYRLGVVKVFIPPLRSRMEDIHPLVQHFLQSHSERLGMAPPLITPEAMAVFYAHSWPGNVRELEHAIEASLVLVEPGDNLEPSHLYHAVPDFVPAIPKHDATTPWLAYQDASRSEEFPPESGKRASEAPSLRHCALAERAGVESAETSPIRGLFSTKDEELPASLPLRAQEMEGKAIEKALTASAGNIALAARLLGISPQLLHYKMKKYSVRRQDFLPRRL